MIIFSNRVVTSEGTKPAFLKVENGKIEGIYDGSANLKADVDYGNHRIIPPRSGVRLKAMTIVWIPVIWALAALWS